MVSVVGVGWKFPPPLPVQPTSVWYGYRILNPKSFLNFPQGLRNFAFILPPAAVKFCLFTLFERERISYSLLDLVLLGFASISPMAEMDLCLSPEGEFAAFAF